MTEKLDAIHGTSQPTIDPIRDLGILDLRQASFGDHLGLRAAENATFPAPISELPSPVLNQFAALKALKESYVAEKLAA